MGLLAIEEVRGAAAEAEKAEFFETPRRAVEELLASGPDLPGGRWLDPCAGRGIIPRVVLEQRTDVHFALVELRSICRTELEQLGADDLVIGDFLRDDRAAAAAAGAQVVIMNSPFTLTLPFVLRAWELSDAWVVSLQRQGWFGSQERAEWLSEHCPDRYTLPFRPSFRADRRTDGCEYEWHIWPPGPGRNRRAGVTAMLRDRRQLSLF